jgi:branched-chain amino acid transport system substrate-binding protein
MHRTALSRRSLLASAATALPLARARAQAPTLRIGVLSDMSGPFKDLAGPLTVAAAHQAIAEFGVATKGFNAEVLSADHQNKPDIGVTVARQWFDRDGVDVITEVGNSGVALAVAGVVKEKNKVFLPCGAGITDLTGSACTRNTIHWAYDTYMFAKSTGGAMVKAGGDTWFFITADFAYGHAITREVTRFVEAAGGKVLGGVTAPFPGVTDFSSFLLKAQASGAKVIGLANAGADTINCIKQAHEFGITQKLGGLVIYLTDVHALGLDVAQGLVLSQPFYWDLNDRTRAFSERFKAKAPNKRPTVVQAGVYSAVLHYLKTAQAMGAAEAKKDGVATVNRMKAMPPDDDCFGPSTIRADGRKMHPCHLFEVKKPSESRYPWDYYKLLATTPADQAFRPLNEGGCPFINA